MAHHQPSGADYPGVVYHPVVEMDSSSKLPPGVNYTFVSPPDDSGPLGVVLLPEIVIDCRTTFILRLWTPPDDVTADPQQLLTALGECDTALRGTGLVFDPIPEGSGALVFNVLSKDPTGAAERMTVLRQIVCGTNDVAGVPSGLVERVRALAAHFHVNRFPG